jgi:valyl-tRNA synthetase
MPIELPKQYDPHEAQKRWLTFWNERGYFHSRPDQARRPFSIVIPPPNVTGALHMGHALNNTLQDVLIRWRRMQGYNALWIPGTDHAGIATQAVVERRVKEEEGKTRHDIGREALVARIWQWKDQYETRILRQLRELGASCDWARKRFTLDPVCARAVRHTFFKMFKDELIYSGKRLVNWDTHLQTAVADDEIFHETVKGGFWTFRYPVKESPNDSIRFSTTRPETMLGDTAVAVHPEDPRYKHLIGKTATVPLVKREIPIIADAELVDPELGTGAVKVTPAHDPNDYKCGLRHTLPMINILNPDGTINANGGPYAGMDRYQARERVTEDMAKLGLFDDREDRDIDLAHSDRSKTPIEPYLSDQWFVRMPDLAQSAIDAVVTDNRVKFFPERYKKTYEDWLGEKRDWCISRQLWWGHQIPVWTARCYDAAVRDLLEHYVKTHPDLAAYMEAGKLAVRTRLDDECQYALQVARARRTSEAIDEYKRIRIERPFAYVDVCLLDADTDRSLLAIQRLKEFGFERDPDVLDTWFSSTRARCPSSMFTFIRRSSMASARR